MADILFVTVKELVEVFLHNCRGNGYYVKADTQKINSYLRVRIKIKEKKQSVQCICRVVFKITRNKEAQLLEKVLDTLQEELEI